MSEEKRYMDEEWNDLPLPDGETAWQKMELLLDDDKKRRRIIPFWLWRYAGLGLLLIGVAAGFLWLRRNEKANNTTTVAEKKTIQQPKGGKTAPPTSENHDTPPSNDLTEHTPKHDIRIIKQPNRSDKNVVIHQTIATPDKAGKWNNRFVKKNGISKTKIKPQGQGTDKTSLSDRPAPQKGFEKEPAAISTPIAKDSVIISSAKTDSVLLKDTSVKKVAEPMVTNDPKGNKPKKKAAFIFSAGIGLQRAIALNNQRSSSFNYKGKRSTGSDLIPSVYLRLQKGDWFVQAEFQYAAPQPVEQFSFSQKTRYDAASLNVKTERLNIQKLYYHQLPFSINYQLLENWSVGAGSMYNILAGAVTEQEIESKNVQTGAETITRNLAPVKGYKDSFLYKTTAGVLLQTDYHWKRFSLGMRFTQNLQPFIKYTKPDGTVLDEKNNVLQAILRFRLF